MKTTLNPKRAPRGEARDRNVATPAFNIGKKFYETSRMSAAECAAVTAQVHARARAAASPGKDPSQRRMLDGTRVREPGKCLENALALASFHCPERPEVAAYFRAAREAVDTPDYWQTIQEMRVSAAAGDAEAMRALAGVVKESVRNWMHVTGSWLNWYDVADLAHNEQFYLTHEEHPTLLQVQTVGVDGTPDPVQATPIGQEAHIPFRKLSTDIFSYPLLDLERGFDVREKNLSTVDLARDMATRFDAIAQGFFIAGSAGHRYRAPFTITDANPLNNDFVVYGNVDTANLPTTNLITPASSTTSTTMRKEILDIIIAYANDWGQNTLFGGGLTAVEVRVPSKASTHWLSSVQITNIVTSGSGAGPSNVVADQILTGGTVLDYGGVRWNIVPDVSLSPTAGWCYVRFNKPAGYVRFKPELDEVKRLDDAAMQRANREGIYMTKVYAMGFTNAQYPNALAVRYKTV